MTLEETLVSRFEPGKGFGIPNINHFPRHRSPLASSERAEVAVAGEDKGIQTQETVLEPCVPSVITLRIHDRGKFYSPEEHRDMVRERDKQSASMRKVLAITRAVIQNIS